MSEKIKASIKKFKEESEYNSQGHVTPMESKKWTLAYFTLGVIALFVVLVGYNL